MADLEIIQEELTLKVQAEQTSLEVPGTQTTLEITGPSHTLEILDQRPRLIVNSPGPTGVAGSTAYVLTAGEVITAYRAVVLLGDMLYLADPTDLSHVGHFVGVARNSALVGEEVAVMYVGPLTGGSFTQDARYYLGLGGILSTSPTAVGALWRLFLGTAKDSSTLILTPGPPILL